MKIFLSYGHDSNEPLIEKTKEYPSKFAEGNLMHEVWIEMSEIKARMDLRENRGKQRIYPMSIEPRAELLSDKKDNYHLGEI